VPRLLAEIEKKKYSDFSEGVGRQMRRGDKGCPFSGVRSYNYGRVCRKGAEKRGLEFLFYLSE